MTIPVEAGRCWRCGTQMYHGLQHSCITAPIPSSAEQVAAQPVAQPAKCEWCGQVIGAAWMHYPLTQCKKEAQPADEVSGLVERLRGHAMGSWPDLAMEAAAALESLARQLPEGMQHCTIRFQKCSVGHGWLTATNWVQHECLVCRAESAEARAAAAEAMLAACERDAQRYREREEVYAYEREHNRRQIELLVSHLSGIHALIQGEHIKLPDGRVMEFAPKAELILECWRALSQAIRDVPKAIDAALASAGKGKA